MEDRGNTSNVDEVEKPTKEEYAVAKFIRFNVPAKKAKLHNMEVQCFVASAAVDALMESKWSASKNAKEPLFVNRNSCVSYCQRLLEKGLFHRAERVQRKKDKDKGERSKKKKVKDAAEKEEGGTGDELRERKIQKDKNEKEEEDLEKTTALEGEEVKEEKKTEEKKTEEKKTEEKKTEEKKTEEKKDGKKNKKEKPMKLLMTDDQMFEDGDQNIYVWIYDPVNAQTLVIGSLIVFGVAALCLFPLWPPFVRIGVYYTSLTAAGFVGFILSLVVLRFILFCAIWLLTLGRHHFWLLPNLTEDVSLQESFQPLYKHNVVLPESSATGKTYSKSRSGDKAKGKARKKDKSSDQEDSASEPEFEIIHRGDVEEDEGEERMEGEEEEDSEDNGDAREEGEYGADKEEGEEDYEEEEEGEGENDGLEEEEEEEEESVLKKDK